MQWRLAHGLTTLALTLGWNACSPMLCTPGDACDRSPDPQVSSGSSPGAAWSSSTAPTATSAFHGMDGGTAWDGGQAGDAGTSGESNLGSTSSPASWPSSGPGASSAVASSSHAGPTLNYTLVVMPDTQNYVRPDNNLPPRNDKELYLSGARWVRDHAAQEKLAFVLHEGDLTNFNTQEEYNIIDEGVRIMESSLPFFFTLGNHDLSNNGFAMDRNTLAGTVFPVSRYLGLPTFGGVFEAGTMSNSWHVFDAGVDHYLLIMMEFAPRDEVLTWAAQTADSHPGRTVILTTHDYLYWDDTRVGTPGRQYDYAQCGYGVAQLPNVSCNNGEDIWQKLVRLHPNIRFIFNGHQLEDGLGRLVSLNDAGLPVFQLLVNYQIVADGSVRLLRFWDDGRIQVRAYSAALNTWRLGDQDQFDIDVVNGVFEPARSP